MTMSSPNQQAAPYPKSKLLAASGITALLCFVLLVYPSRHVEAQKTHIEISIDGQQESSDLLLANEDDFDILQQEEELAQAAAETEQFQLKSITVKSGDTLSKIFNQVGLGNGLLASMLKEAPEAKQLVNLKINQTLVFKLSEQGDLIELSSQINSLDSIHVTKDEQTSTFVFSKHTKQTSTEQLMVSGTIESSLLAATKQAGLPYKLTLDLANIFGFEIDFAQDLREGDSFKVIFEQNKIDDKVVSSGNILAASFTNKGKTHTAIRYTNKDGYSSYYDGTGSSTQKAFIRTPVDFTRISSKFSLGRKHPVLNRIRAHKGVDYAAPTGTPVKATGDGKVIIASARGGYGNTVIIQHGSKYRTVYAHLRNFAKGIRSGSEVKQGQIIGYVGTTGLSTGPHLHYEFQVKGVHVDPLSHTLPAADPIPKNEIALFKKQAMPYLAMLEQGNQQLAMAKSTQE